MGTTRALAEVQSAESETSLLQIEAASGTIISIDGDPVGAAPLTATVAVSPFLRASIASKRSAVLPRWRTPYGRTLAP